MTISAEEPIINDELDLWQQLDSDSCGKVRDKIICHYLGLVRQTATHVYLKQNQHDIDLDDYIQLGTVGLIESIDRFDWQKNIRFSSFASYRIKGAILNGIQNFTEKRKQYSFAKQAQADRVTSITSVDSEAFKQSVFARMVETTVNFAISYILDSEDHPVAIDGNPYNSDELRRLKSQMRDLVGRLKENEQEVLRCHYFYHLSFESIAKLMSLSKARVSQLHKSGLDNLRKLMDHSETMDVSY